ncbi:alpha/beta fold hydrolase [Oceanicella actignis]|uniref:alpha/beta fold hydrolase n=1 Tax=Oceanicella actignis TaxID=1189325 RepID=UPI0011E6D0D3|nr:alpha/beta fold hydrolase [Oceanicella actignis]TYO89975.1 pimeloyl-ACP methyl ester carboxylesterase [Oceanicella actignis]
MSDAQLRHEFVRVRDLIFRCLTAGPRDAPMILMLHGFPEYSGAWEEMIARLSDSFFCVAPDQRGYAGSSKPEAVEAYAGGKLAGDALAILEHFRPGGRAAAVFGHDWGASVAYALSFRAPERMERLIIANGVHPIPFQRELARGGAQSEASQYIEWLRAEGSEKRLAEDDFNGMLRLFSAKMDLSWLSGARLQRYKTAWAAPGALRGMVNWYRATPLRVARPGSPIPPEELPALPPEALRVRVPHLLLWGLKDTALLPETRQGLDALCDDLTVREFAKADHWILHQTPDEVAEEVRAFLSRPAPAAG